MPPLKIPVGRRGMPPAISPPPARLPQPPSYFQMRQQLEAAEQDPARAFAPPHAGQKVTAQCHLPQGSSRASITQSHCGQGVGLPGAAFGIRRTPGASTSAPNKIKLLQCFWLLSSQPHTAAAQATSISQTTAGTSLALPKASTSAPQ